MIRTKQPIMKKGVMRAFITKHAKSKVHLPLDKRPKAATQIFPPDGTIFKKGEYWCPYCANVFKFLYNDYVGVWHCPNCGISERDYHVKRANKIK